MRSYEQARSEYFKAIAEYQTALDAYFATYKDDDGEAYEELKRKAKILWQVRAELEERTNHKEVTDAYVERVVERNQKQPNQA